MSPAPDPLRETQVASLASPADLAWARAHPEALADLRRESDRITARVLDDHQWFHASSRLAGGQIFVGCTCPKELGAVCRHLTVLLLRWANDPADFPEEADRQDPDALQTTPVAPPPIREHTERPLWITPDRLAARIQEERDGLAEVFRSRTLREMRDLAAESGWSVRGSRRDEVAEQLVRHFVDPASLRTALATLDPGDAAALRALMILGGRPRLADGQFASVVRWLGIPDGGGPMLRRLASLERRALLPIARQHWGGAASSVEVPWLVMRTLPPALEGVLPHKPVEGDPPGEVRLADPTPLVEAASHLLVVFAHRPARLRAPQPRPTIEHSYPALRGWGYDPEEVRDLLAQGALQNRGPQLSLTVPPPERALDDGALAQYAPLAGGEDRLDMLYALLVNARVLHAGSPVTVWEEVLDHYLRRDARGQRAILAESLFTVRGWDVLWEMLRRNPALRLVRRVGAWSPPFTLAQFDGQLAAVRHIVLRVVASAPEARWVDVKDLAALLRIVLPAFNPSPVISEALYYGVPWEVQVAKKEGAKGKDQDPQAAYLEALLSGPLHWLGFADLCLRGGRLAAVRLHGLGDLYWERTEAPPFPPHVRSAPRPAPEEALAVSGRTLSAPPRALPPAAHHLLGHIARLEEASPERFRYVLDVERTRQTFEHGALFEELALDWERQLSFPMPPAVREPLEAWWTAYGRVRIYQHATVIEMADDHALAEMRAVTSLDKVLIAELSPRLVVVPREDVGTLLEELERAGYTPKWTDAI